MITVVILKQGTGKSVHLTGVRPDLPGSLQPQLDHDRHDGMMQRSHGFREDF